jgi:hypothetical protein
MRAWRWPSIWGLSGVLALSLFMTLQLCHALFSVASGSDQTGISISYGLTGGKRAPLKQHPSCDLLAGTSHSLAAAVRVVLKDRPPRFDDPVVAAPAWSSRTVAWYLAARPAHHFLPSRHVAHLAWH